MKLFFSIFFLFLVEICFSQRKDLNIIVEYQIFFDTRMPFKIDATLFANDKIAIFQEKYSTKEKWEEKKSKLIEGTIMGGAKSTYDPYLKINHVKKEMFFFDRILDNNFLIKDNFVELNWVVGTETKYITGLTCIKATTSFRGRDWTVWFAPELPLPFGPWKLHGLPGLILEAHDSLNVYTMKATKIEFKTNDILNKDFKGLMNTKNRVPISYRQFLAETDEAMDNIHNKINQDHNFAAKRTPVQREGMELIYEWE